MASEKTREEVLSDLAAKAISSYQGYAQHFDWCAFKANWQQGAVNCDCGYTRVLRELMDKQIEVNAFGVVHEGGVSNDD